MQANQTPKPRWNPMKFPTYPPRDDHQPRHFREDHFDEENIADVDQGTEEKDDQWETSKIVDGGHDQMPDSIPKEDSGLGSAVCSLLHTLNERIEALESSMESQNGWNDKKKLGMDQILQILDLGEILKTKTTTRIKRSAQ